MNKKRLLETCMVPSSSGLTHGTTGGVKELWNLFVSWLKGKNE